MRAFARLAGRTPGTGPGGKCRNGAGRAAGPADRRGRAGDRDRSGPVQLRADVVTANAGIPLTISAVSRSRISHNLTIVTPDGQFLESEDMRAGRTVTIRIALPQPGRYVFYCAVRFHRRPFRMEGMLVAQ